MVGAWPRTVEAKAACQSLDPRLQLGYAQWFVQKVIGTGAQRSDDVLFRVVGGNEQDSARPAVIVAQGRENVEAVDFGQVPVQHDKVIGRRLHGAEQLTR